MSDQFVRGSGGRIRTSDLWVMSPTSCHCSTPRYHDSTALQNLRGARSGLASHSVTTAVLSGAALGHDRVRDGTGWGQRALGHGHPASSRLQKSCPWLSLPRYHRAHHNKHNTKIRILHQSLGPLGSSLLPAVHLWPIYPVVSWGSLVTEVTGMSRLEVRFPLRCLQRFARPNVATQLCCYHNNWITSGPSTPVLSY